MSERGPSSGLLNSDHPWSLERSAREKRELKEEIVIDSKKKITERGKCDKDEMFDDGRVCDERSESQRNKIEWGIGDKGGREGDQPERTALHSCVVSSPLRCLAKSSEMIVEIGQLTIASTCGGSGTLPL